MDPFQIKMDDKIYRISSGAAVPANIKSVIKNAKLPGSAAKDAFVSDRLRKNELLFEPIKRLKQKVFADMEKISKNCYVQYKQQANAAFLMLQLSQKQSEKIYTPLCKLIESLEKYKRTCFLLIFKT